MATSQAHRHAIVPIALASVGAALLIGCIPIPLGERKIKGTDYRRVAGEDGQFLENGRTTRQQIEARLGPPQMRAGGERFAGYLLETNSGVWVMPLCFQAVPIKNFRLLQLEYDNAGVLLRHEVKKSFTGPHIFTILEAKESNVTLWFPSFNNRPRTRPAANDQ